MCDFLPAISKLLEIAGALMVLVPLYKAVAVHIRYHYAGAERIDAFMKLIQDRASTGALPDPTLELAVSIYKDFAPIESARLGRLEMVLVVSGGLLIAIGGGLEVAERLHLMKEICRT